MSKVSLQTLDREAGRRRVAAQRSSSKKKLMKKTMVAPLVIISTGKGNKKGTKRKRSMGKGEHIPKLLKNPKLFLATTKEKPKTRKVI